MSSASSGSRKREARPGPSSRFLSPPAVGASLSHTSLASWSSGGSASSRHSAKAARLAASGRAPRAVRRASDRAQQREEAQRAVATQVADRLRKRLAPYGGVCWWCLEPGHDPSTCDEKAQPWMGDFESHRPARTRTSRSGKSQTVRSFEGQAVHRAAYKAAHQSRSRELEKLPAARLLAEPARRPTRPRAIPSSSGRDCHVYSRVCVRAGPCLAGPIRAM